MRVRAKPPLYTHLPLKFFPPAPILHRNAAYSVEPSVRQRYFILPSLFVSLFVSLPAAALSFQPRLEHAQWQVEGDQFECRLTQPINKFGAGQFVRRAGEQATFRLVSHQRWMRPGSATLLAAAAPWQPERKDIDLGKVSVGEGEVSLRSSQLQAARLLTGLLEGRSPLVRHRTWQTNEALEVRLLPVSFGKAYADYQHCATQLLPVNFDQVKRLQLGFAYSGIDLDEATRVELDRVLLLLKADPSINQIQLEGHSDNTGNRLTNRDLSRRRALAVANYLKANGIPEEHITVRFHGERYPLVPNSSEANKAKNRRVTLYLDRIEPSAVKQEQVAKGQGTANPA